MLNQSQTILVANLQEARDTNAGNERFFSWYITGSSSSLTFPSPTWDLPTDN